MSNGTSQRTPEKMYTATQVQIRIGIGVVCGVIAGLILAAWL